MLLSGRTSVSEGIEHFTAWFLAVDPSLSSLFWLAVSLLADAVLPRHFCLLVLGGGDEGLGDLAWRGLQRGQWRSTLFCWNARGLGGQGRGWLMEVVEWRLGGEVVVVEVLVKVVVGLEIRQSLHLLRWLWCSGQGHTHNLGQVARVCEGLGWLSSTRGRVAAAGCRVGSAQDVRLRYAVPDGLVGRVQLLLVGGPGLAAGDRLQSVCATGWRVSRRGGATTAAVTEGGDARAGAA